MSVPTPNADGIANRAMMKRARSHETCVLVEGIEDYRVYAKFLDLEFCRIEVCFGRDNVGAVLSILKSRSFDGVLAVRDADFSALERRAGVSPHMVKTDWHDIETMMLWSSALRQVVVEWTTSDRPPPDSREVLHIVVGIAEWIGYLRWLSEIDSLGLFLRDIDIARFVDKKGVFSWANFIDYVQERSRKGALDPDHLRRRCSELKDPSHDRRHVCSGHDMCRVLAHLFVHRWGGKATSGADIEKALRIAYHESEFHSSDLWRAVCEWERDNPPFRVH